MVYDVSDLSISLSIEDQSNGKIVELIALDPITFEAGSMERVKASGMFIIPTLLLRLYNMVTSEGSVVHLVLRAEFGYMMGLMSWTWTQCWTSICPRMVPPCPCPRPMDRPIR